MEAIIKLEYDDAKIAQSIAKAVSPDNLKAPTGLEVLTETNDNQVLTKISLDGKLATFIATIDDLLESISTAEKTLRVVRRK